MAKPTTGPVTLLFYNHSSSVSGAEVILLDLLRGLAAWDTQNPTRTYRLLLACPADGPLWERASLLTGVELAAVRPLEIGYTRSPLTLGRYGFRLLTTAFSLGRLVRRYRPILLHANSVRAGLVAGLVTPLTGTRLLVHLHDAMGQNATNEVIRLILGRLAWRLVAISDYTRHAFTRQRPDLLKKCVRIYNGVDTEYFRPHHFDGPTARANLLTQWPSSEGVAAGPLLAIVGQITPWKGHREAIEALALLRQKWGQAGLLIVGGLKFATANARYDNASYHAELQELICHHKLQNAVWFAGEHSDVRPLMAGVDLLVVPSWYEPFGRVVIEAMALEKLVVATRVGGPAEIVEDGTNGLLVEPKDSTGLAQTLEAALADPPKSLEMGRQARQRVMEQFTVARMVAEFLELYAQAHTQGQAANRRGIFARLGKFRSAGRSARDVNCTRPGTH